MYPIRTKTIAFFAGLTAVVAIASFTLPNLPTANAKASSATNTHTTKRVVPAGATAQCNDGTYSFSAHRRGTCSYHRGVARWI